MATPVVVFDTSVLFSYVFKPGRPYYLLGALRTNRLVAVTCRTVIAELREVALRHVSTAQVDAFLNEFQQLTKSFPDPSTYFAHQTDPKDSVFLNLAIEARADYLVSYDEAHILALRDVTHEQHELLGRMAPNLKIVKPFELARLLASAATRDSH